MKDEKKCELDRLGQEVRAEIESYHGLLRRAGVHLFRAGRSLFEAKNLVKDVGVSWAEWLSQQEIADSTARQAIDLYRNAKAMGHEEIDLDGLSITDAKIKYGIVAPKPKKVKETTPTANPPPNDVTPPERGVDTHPTQSQDDTHPVQGKGGTPDRKEDMPPPKGFGGRVKERSLLKLEEIFGEETEAKPITLPQSSWKLLDILMCQEEVDEPGMIVSRAVREYWLRHGDPVQVSRIPDPSHEPEPQLVYSGASS